MKYGVILFVVLLLALVWVAVAAQDIPPASVNPPLTPKAPPFWGTVTVAYMPIIPLGTPSPPSFLYQEPALPDAEVPLFIIPTLEPESVGEVPLIVIPSLQDVAAVARWIIQALGDTL